METIFNKDAVTIVRKKGDNYEQEEICTRKVLPGSNAPEWKIRENVIAKLRLDPTVVVVLEDLAGRCQETFEHGEYTVSIVMDEGEPATGQIRVSRGGVCVCEEDFPAVIIDKSSGEPMKDVMVAELIEILEEIDRGDQDFFNMDLPVAEWTEICDEAFDIDSIYDVFSLMEEKHYEMEQLHTIDFVNPPILFVHENELVLIGEEHFFGNFFVEMKRIFRGAEADLVNRYVNELDAFSCNIRCFQHENGSWGFRTGLPVDLRVSTTVKLLEEAVAKLCEFIEKVESKMGFTEEPVRLHQEVRSLFIYEVIDASLKLSKLKI